MSTLQEWQLWWDFTDALWVLCLIVGSFALTLMTDAARVPKKTPTLFWQHWWHTPLLICTSIGLLYPLSLLSYALVHSTLLAQAIATIQTYLIVAGLWLFFTRRSSLKSGKHSGEDRSAVTTLLVVGTALFLLGLLPLVLNSLGFWVFTYVRVLALGVAPWLILTGLLIYYIGFSMRLSKENSQTKQTLRE